MLLSMAIEEKEGKSPCLPKLQDERWSVYQNRFSTLPIFCFNDLHYPSDYDEAITQISRLNLEQQNIESQFKEREVELGSVSPEEYAQKEREYKDWKTKALRAQRVKFSQIRVLEAWLLDFPPSFDMRIKTLEKKTRRLENWLISLGYEALEVDIEQEDLLNKEHPNEI